MTWWAWILFWAVFWTLALAFLAWRVWRVWPHAREFGRTCSQALDRVETARASVESRASTEHSTALTRSSSEDLAWNLPVSHWREQRRRQRTRRRELRLDDHTQVWASWRDPLD